tara:strand:- start:3074 stop:4471 length:1398 start_codon:yes stop_codon:yes gene_type:complete
MTHIRTITLLLVLIFFLPNIAFSIVLSSTEKQFSHHDDHLKHNYSRATQEALESLRAFNNEVCSINEKLCMNHNQLQQLIMYKNLRNYSQSKKFYSIVKIKNHRNDIHYTALFLGFDAKKNASYFMIAPQLAENRWTDHDPITIYDSAEHPYIHEEIGNILYHFDGTEDSAHDDAPLKIYQHNCGLTFILARPRQNDNDTKKTPHQFYPAILYNNAPVKDKKLNVISHGIVKYADNPFLLAEQGTRHIGTALFNTERIRKNDFPLAYLTPSDHGSVVLQKFHQTQVVVGFTHHRKSNEAQVTQQNTQDLNNTLDIDPIYRYKRVIQQFYPDAFFIRKKHIEDNFLTFYFNKEVNRTSSHSRKSKQKLIHDLMVSTHKYYKKQVHLIVNQKYKKNKIYLPTKFKKNKNIKGLKIKITSKNLSNGIHIKYLNEYHKYDSVMLHPYYNPEYMFEHVENGLFRVIPLNE